MNLEPRSAIRVGVIDLMPRSTATTRNRGSPSGLTTVLGGAHLIGEMSAHHRRLRLNAFQQRGCTGFHTETPTRIAPRSRMWRVRARVSTSRIPTTPWA